MNKVTRICVFVLLIAISLFLIYVCVTNFIQAKILLSDYNLNHEAWITRYDNVYIVGFIIGDYIAKSIVTGIACILINAIAFSNLKWFFPENVEKRELIKQRKAQKLQEKLNNLKGDE